MKYRDFYSIFLDGDKENWIYFDFLPPSWLCERKYIIRSIIIRVILISEELEIFCWFRLDTT